MADRRGAGRVFVWLEPLEFERAAARLTPTATRVLGHIVARMNLRSLRCDDSQAEIVEMLSSNGRRASRHAVADAMSRLLGSDPALVGKVGPGRYMLNPTVITTGDPDQRSSLAAAWLRVTGEKAPSYPGRRGSMRLLKVSPSMLARACAALSPQQLRVLACMLSNMDRSKNLVAMSQREMISAMSGDGGPRTSFETVISAMRLLRCTDYDGSVHDYDPFDEPVVVKVDDALYKVNPSFAYQGSLARYDQIAAQFLNAQVFKNREA